MSKLLNKTIPLNGVKVNQESSIMHINGKLGSLSVKMYDYLDVQVDDVIKLIPNRKLMSGEKAMVGTVSALVRNAVVGVSQGHHKALEINGVGYKASVAGKKLQLKLGFSHDVNMEIPESMDVKVEGNAILMSHYCKQTLGDFADSIYRLRPVEPYKGKGVRYRGQIVIRKQGKAGKNG